MKHWGCYYYTNATVCVGGNAYLHWRLSRFFEAEEDEEKQLQHREHAVTAISVALTQLPSKAELRKGEGIAFFIGNAGTSLYYYHFVHTRKALKSRGY